MLGGISMSRRRRSWRSVGRFRFLKWPLFFGVAALAAGLSAHRFGGPGVLPVKSIYLDSATTSGSFGPALAQIVQETQRFWQGKNRLILALKARRLIREISAGHPYIKEIHFHWAGLLLEGRARMGLTLRVPLARAKEGGRDLCLDDEGVAFACPKDSNAGELPVLGKSLDREARAAALGSLPAVQKLVGDIVVIEALGRLGLVFQNQDGQRFEFLISDLVDTGRLSRALAGIGAALDDLAQRQEKFRYIDAMLAQEGRVIVGKV